MSALTDQPTLLIDPARLRPSKRPVVVAVLLSALGLIVQAGGYAIARTGTAEHAALALFYVGLLVVMLPPAWMLLAATPSRTHRIALVIWSGLAFFLSMWQANPTVLGRFDELLHQGTLWQLVEARELFSNNTMLPISPYYPGLELMAAAVHWLTGLPTVPSALVVVVVSRLLTVVALFLVAERLTHSSRSAGIAVLLYLTGPQMYTFNAQFAYQSLAVALAVGAVHFILQTIDGHGAAARRSFVLATVALTGVALTHHLTSWLTLGLLGVTATWLWLTGRRAAARVVVSVVVANLLVVATWTAIVGRRLFDYLSPLFEQAGHQLLGIVLGSSAPRKLFSDGGGAPSPLWEQLTMLASSMLWCLLLAATLWQAIIRGRDILRGKRASWLVFGIAAAYPGLLLARFSPAAADVSDRASTFVFLALSIVVAGWVVYHAPRVRVPVAAALYAVLLIGGVIIGSGPDWSRIPGPWLPSADQRSVDASTLRAAEWARDHLSGQEGMAADRVDADLMLAIGRQRPVTPLSHNRADIQWLYVADTLSSTREVLDYGDIRLVVVDRRLADVKPYIAAYFQANDGSETRSPNSAQLEKFATSPGSTAIYDNGDVVIYDVSALRGRPPVPVATTAAPPRELDVLDPVPLVAAAVGIGAWLLLRRRLRTEDIGDRIVSTLVAGSVGLMGGGLVVILTGMSAAWVAGIVVVGALLASYAVLRRVRGLPLRVVVPRFGRIPAALTLAIAVTVSVAGGAAIASADSVLSAPEPPR